MKIIRYVGAVLLAAFAGQGCSLLDTTPDGRETLDQIFADHDKTAAYLNTCYSKLPTKGTSYYWVCNAPTALSDEGYLVSGTINDAIPAKMYTSGGTASSHPLRDYNGPTENYYSIYMLQLRYCTTFLQYIDKAGVNSESERARWRAEAQGADYLGVGAVFPTGTKDDAAPLSHDTLRAICEAVSIPVVAIGGITRENLPQLAGSGISGIAVVSAIYAAADIPAATRSLKDAVRAIVEA